jgi:hypothetical protein
MTRASGDEISNVSLGASIGLPLRVTLEFEAPLRQTVRRTYVTSAIWSMAGASAAWS